MRGAHPGVSSERRAEQTRCEEPGQGRTDGSGSKSATCSKERRECHEKPPVLERGARVRSERVPRLVRTKDVAFAVEDACG